MVCANCGSESHHTGHSACQNYCTLCAQSGHRIHESHGAFTHGHLNVALSRVRHRSDLAILVDNHNYVADAATNEMCAVTANVVYYSIVNA